MSRIAVVTDTTQYLPSDVIARHGIHLVSLYVNWDGRTDREIDLPDYDAYYDFLRSAGDLPTTSQPSLGDFLEVYEPLVEAGDEVLSVHLSGGISGTVRAAEQARELLIERGMPAEQMVVVDSQTGSAGHGFMAVAAANAVERGADLQGAVEAANKLREDLQILVMVDTLEYLRRGGRIGAAAAWIGATLKVKPILTIEGEMKPVERVRTAGRAFERLVAHLEQRHENGCDAFAIQHIQAPAEAERLAERGREIFGRDPEMVSEIGPVIGTHTGPGILGVAGLRTELLGPM
ncbi:DegV family protein [Solirubrobacter sp. CPCC 204708]|uniref:DegV family protein n=1 Tax=Solirubrobacter deserti TaxID=2282478 RepID=A0ABT4RFX4_9ACTN|nr:DegV family protein [Solirubrobacter deserti]MBE2318141.1 DegV family protein [Solirubrobacter deserti]MDA0137420.1 DegV family protein [Solirubrobacter deserti]